MQRPTGSDSDLETRRQLVFAIAHEIANHLGAIRLQAHLLDEELGPRALAEASVAIDGLAGRGTPLLALLRPILAATAPAADHGDRGRWSDVLSGIRREVEDEGTRSVRFELEPPADPAALAPGVDWLDPLVMALVQATLAHVDARGAIRLALEADDGGREQTLLLEDDGAEEDCAAGTPLRGRPLVVAIARLLLGGIGGRVEAGREKTTHLRLVFPAEPAR